jgi:hypothetical protein
MIGPVFKLLDLSHSPEVLSISLNLTNMLMSTVISI